MINCELCFCLQDAKTDDVLEVNVGTSVEQDVGYTIII